MALMKQHADPEPLSAWSPLASWRWLDDLFHTSDGHQLIKVEEVVRDGVMVVRAEVPGMDPEKDVNITVESGALHIRAQRTQEEESSGERWHRREFRYGSFGRVIPLPEGVAEESITAEYKDGILEVHIPMPNGAEKSAGHRVLVSHN